VCDALKSLSADAAANKRSRRNELARLWIFLGLSAVVSWTVWLLPLEKQGSYYLQIFGVRIDFPFLLIKALIGNCLPGLVALIWTASLGAKELHDLTAGICRWNTSPSWYLASIFLPPLLYCCALGIVLAYTPTAYTLPGLRSTAVVFLATLPFAPVLEELAWRAFALRKLEQHYSRINAALIIGVFWAFWHVPLWIVTLNFGRGMLFAMVGVSLVNVLAWSVVFAFFYGNSSRSLPVVILLHAAYLTASNQVSTVSPSRNFLVLSVFTLLSVCLAVVLARRMEAQRAELPS